MGSPFQVSTREGEDRSSPARELCPVEKVDHLGRPCRHVALAEVKGDPAGQIHLARGHDRHEPRVLADLGRGEHLVHALELDQRVTVEPVHHLTGSECVGGKTLAAKDLLVSIAHGPALDQVHQRVGQEGRVHTQVLFVSEVRAQGLEQGPQGKGDTAAVLDDRCHVGCDLIEHLVDRPSVEIDEFFRRVNEHVEARHAHKGVPKGARGLCVDLSHDKGSLFHRLPGNIDGRPEAAVACLVGRRDLDKGHIDRDLSGFDQPGDSGERAWNQIDPARCNRLAGHPAGEEGLQAILLGMKLLQGDGIAQAHDLDQLQVTEIAGLRGHQVLDQRPRFCHAGADEDAHPGLDPLQHLFRRDDPILPVRVSPLFHWRTPVVVGRP